MRKIGEGISRSPKRRKANGPDSDRLLTLPKDLKLKLVNFLTLEELLKLSSCSSGLRLTFTIDEVWKEFISRISPSLLKLPMKTLSSSKEKLKLFLGKNLRQVDIKELKLHYILKILGSKYVATMGNAIGTLNGLRFRCGQDFGSTVPYHRVAGACLRLFLTMDDRTSVLLQETQLYANNLENNTAKFYQLFDEDNLRGLEVRVQFSWTRDQNLDCPGYFTGVDNIEIEIFDVDDIHDEQYDPLLDFLVKHLQWY